MHARQRHRVEHGEDLFFNLRRCEMVAWGGRLGSTAAEPIRSIDPPAFGDRPHPAVPEVRIAGKAMHHHHGYGRLPRPQVIVDGAMKGKPLGKVDRCHQWAPLSWATCTAISARPALATAFAGPAGPRD